jgi:hypothetical protein
MKNILVMMKDGEERYFPHRGRLGGSYSKSIRYEGCFAIIKDEWGKEIAIPANDIKEIIVEELRY